MNPRAEVDSTTQSLGGRLVPDIRNAEIQLPDFQRDWVWNDRRIRDLLSSISLSYPIGAVMLLEVGNNAEFGARLITGAPRPSGNKKPKSLVLDGQQRLTALFQVLAGEGPVVVGQGPASKLTMHYYIHIPAALGELPDEADAVLSCANDKLLHSPANELSVTLEDETAEFEHHLFPVRKVFDPGKWHVAYLKHHNFSAEAEERFERFSNTTIDAFKSYRIPVITLGESTPLDAVCQVFERVNTAGEKLSVFDLMTAKFASTGFRLRDDWQRREKKLRSSQPRLLSDWPENDSLRDDFLQSVALLVTYDRWSKARNMEGASSPTVGCRQKQILTIDRYDYEAWADKAEEGWVEAAKLLHEEKIFTHRDLPYRSQLIPLAAILSELGKDAETAKARSLIRQWFWCGVLGELYGSQPHSRFAADIQQVTALVRGHHEKSTTIDEADFSTNRLAKLRSRNSAAYKGVNVLVMQHGAMDFFTKQKIEDVSFFADQIDIHHVFPQRWCNRNGIDPEIRDCILNRTPLRDNTNKRIAARSPSEYIADPEMAPHAEEVLGSHATGIEALKSDDFDGLLLDRAERLLALIDAAMGKSPRRDILEFMSQ